MSTPVLETYLAGIDPSAAPHIRALDAAVRAAAPELDLAIKYGILMYALNKDWHTWVCALDVTKKGACIRFLYGVLMEDPRKVLRKGSSVLMTWDLPLNQPVDQAAVSAYVSEAVAKNAMYKADRGEIRAAARQTGKKGKA